MGSSGKTMGAITGGVFGGPVGAIGGGILGNNGFFDQRKVEQEIPQVAMPYIQNAQNAANTYQQNTINPLNYAPTQGQTQAAQFGQGQIGSTAQGASNYINQVLGGQFLTPGSNPFLQSYLDKAQQEFQGGLNYAQNSLQSPFQMAGQNSRSGVQNTQNRILGQRAVNDYGLNVNNILGQNYAQERGNQNAALGLANMPNQIASSGALLSSIPQELAQQYQQAQLGQQQQSFDNLLQLLGQLPIGYPNYAPSQFTQVMDAINSPLRALGGGQGIAALGGMAKAAAA